MYASTYTPPITGVKQAPGTIADPEMQDAANAFEKLYPGITINFVPGTRRVRDPVPGMFPRQPPVTCPMFLGCRVIMST